MSERTELCVDYEKVTKDWLADPKNEDVLLLRKLMASTLRMQYFLVDAYCRGKTVYHRHGTLVGNGVPPSYSPYKSLANFCWLQEWSW